MIPEWLTEARKPQSIHGWHYNPPTELLDLIEQLGSALEGVTEDLRVVAAVNGVRITDDASAKADAAVDSYRAGPDGRTT